MKSKIFAIVNQKGGTGKTTTTANLGAALAANSKKVLLVDMDPQASLSYYFGFHNEVYHVGKVLEDEEMDDRFINEISENFHILPGHIELADMELSLVNKDNRVYVLKTILEEYLKSTSYDYILIDCPPSLSLLTINSLNLADEIIVPMQLEVLSMQGLELIQKTVNNLNDSYHPSLKIKGILPIMYDTRKKITQEIIDYINENIKIPIFDSNIRSDVRLVEAPSFAKSILDYAPKSNSANDYRAFAKEIISLG
ncbi:MAG: ParA family protein [Cyclobacteriaceae bacterium]|nr:ParA family protein [Cyclobacteriaceae bacterium]MCH8517039.1 ParA family protein [Cyclobacteriaceae bacterium]